jgi:hypothetical protein
VQPMNGNQEAAVAVQPSSTILDVGAHGAELLLSPAIHRHPARSRSTSGRSRCLWEHGCRCVSAARQVREAA